MTIEYRHILRALAGVLLFVYALAGCVEQSAVPSGSDYSAEPAKGQGPATWLEADERADGLALRAQFDPGQSESGPRVAEQLLELSANLTVVSSAKGRASQAAEKNLVVQQTQDGRTRVLVFSPDNTNSIGKGVLYELSLRRKDKGPASVRFANGERAMFAPGDSVSGLRVGGPLAF